jgi:HNH endonuclease
MSRGTGTTVKTTKRYPRVTAGPLRQKYIHRIVAAALVGRELERDEEVHHKDGDRRNFNWDNLFILGGEDHGWVSSKQAWFMRNRDEKLKAEWDKYMAEEEKKQAGEIAAARSAGEPWMYQDGQLRRGWEERYSA